MDNRSIEEVRKNETKLIKEIKTIEEKNQKLKSQLDFISEQNKYIDKLEKEVKELKELNIAISKGLKR